MLLADLKSMAGGLGIRGAGSMKKAQLVDAIKAAQSGWPVGGQSAARQRPLASAEPSRRPSRRPRPSRRRRAGAGSRRASARRASASDRPTDRHDRQDRSQDREPGPQQDDRTARTGSQDGEPGQPGRPGQDRAARGTRQNQDQQDRSQGRNQQPGPQQPGQRPGQPTTDGGSRRSRRRRGRDRDRDRAAAARRPAASAASRTPRSSTTTCSPRRRASSTCSTTTRSSAPAATCPAPTTSTSRCRWCASTACAAATRSSARCASPARASARRSSTRWCASTRSTAPTPRPSKNRVEFAKLTPLYPSERLRLETEPTNLIGRVIDIAVPDRQGPARADRVAVQGRQDDDHAVDREVDHDQQPRVPPDGRPRRRASGGGHRLRAVDQGRGHLLDLRPAGQRPHDRRRARDRAGQAPRRARPRRRRAARRHHPPRPRLQPGRAGVRPDPVRRRRLGGALPAEEVLRRRPQHRERRLADHPRHRADRERLEDGRGDLRGVQGHRQHGDPAAPRLRRQAPVPRDRRGPERHPPRGAPDEQGGARRSSGSSAGCSPGSTASRPSSCCSSG